MPPWLAEALRNPLNAEGAEDAQSTQRKTKFLLLSSLRPFAKPLRPLRSKAFAVSYADGLT
jgi:hypothetical protein